jgi:hypothetical protein
MSFRSESFRKRNRELIAGDKDHERLLPEQPFFVNHCMQKKSDLNFRPLFFI